MKPIRIILLKEWAEIFQRKIMFLTTAFIPLVFTMVPIFMIWVTTDTLLPGGVVSGVPPVFASTCGDATQAECLQFYILSHCLILYMMAPMTVPVSIAAYSVVGEKNNRSLEPLLSTPIRTHELLLGKSLAAIIPAVLATWLCFGIFQFALGAIGASPAVRAYVLSPAWLMGVGLAGPLMSAAAVNVAVILSSRVSDPRVAEQLSAVLVVPVLGLLFGQVAGFLVMDARMMLATVSALLAVDLVLVYLSARLFQRERILTRWR